MKKIKNLLWVMLAGAGMLAACGKTSYKKTPGGMPYQLFRSKDTQQVRNGSFVKLALVQKINDSVLFTTEKGLPVYLLISNQERPYDIAELWTSLHLGDSLITTQMMDTFIKRSPESIPKEFKNGDRIITHVKVLEIFATDSLARADEEKLKNQIATAEIAEVEKYLADKKITAQKTPSGAYLQIIQPGTGNTPEAGNIVSVNYTGSSWSGVKFDSNTDSAFGHVEPYTFPAGQGRMIKGFDEAVLMMQKGAKVKVYIPSMLAYGPAGNPPKIKPFENLIFDLELIDIQKAGTDQRPMPPSLQKVDVPQPKK